MEGPRAAALKTGSTNEALQAFSKAIDLARGKTNGVGRILAQALLSRSSLLKRLNRFPEGQADFLEAKGIMPRASGSKPNLIDLSGYYNVSLTETWHQSAGHSSDLSELPQGVQKMGGIEFDVRGLVQVGFQSVKGEPYPKQVCGIAVHRPCQRLHFLHSAINAFDTPHGTEIGHYLVRYADGRETKVPLVIGRDLGDWFKQPWEPRAQWETVWTGTNESSRAQNRRIRLFKRTWENPRPDAVVETIDMVSTKDVVAPFLVAVTAEPE